MSPVDGAIVLVYSKMKCVKLIYVVMSCGAYRTSYHISSTSYLQFKFLINLVVFMYMKHKLVSHSSKQQCQMCLLSCWDSKYCFKRYKENSLVHLLMRIHSFIHCINVCFFSLLSLQYVGVWIRCRLETDRPACSRLHLWITLQLTWAAHVWLLEGEWSLQRKRRWTNYTGSKPRNALLRGESTNQQPSEYQSSAISEIQNINEL